MAMHTGTRLILVVSIAVMCEDYPCFGLNTEQVTLNCRAKGLTTFPSPKCRFGNQSKIQELILSKNRIQKIIPSMFSNLKDLETLDLDDNHITHIHPAVFHQLTSLNKLVLSNNYITQITPLMFSGLNSLEKLELENNKIQTIQIGALDGLIRLTDLNLEKNQIQEVPVFNTSSAVIYLNLNSNPIRCLRLSTMSQYPDLTYLHLKRSKVLRLPAKIFFKNTKLRTLDLEYASLDSIDDNAFAGVSISNLNLKGTHISHLPGKGMEFLLDLDIRDVKKLWQLPYKSFLNLQTAEVEYHFHCCLFKQTLNNDVRPTAKNVSILKACPTAKDVITTTQPIRTTTTTIHQTTDAFGNIPIDFEPTKNYSHTFPPNKCVQPGFKITKAKEIKVNCTPPPDAFNPCEDLLGSTGLRVCTWFVSVFALFGNGLQLIVLITSKRNSMMYQVLMCNLSVANLFMGIYLCMLAITDARSFGEYQNHARAWQFGSGCNIAGFLSILSTELAVFILTVITIERYFTIVHPLKLQMHLSTKQIISLVLIGWMFALTMALLPIFNISSYQKVAICLPFDVATLPSKVYVSFLLATNGLAFFVVLYCYARMYCSLGGATCSSTTRIELRVAKKMAMLVLSNFACWFPIALFSFIAIYGSPVINVSTSKFLLVFIYPINAFTNPYLYALGTKHFQLDFLDLLKNFGFCQSGILKLRSRLLDQLASSMPNTSRVYIHGSRSSVNSYRAQSHHSISNKDSTDSSPSYSFSLGFLSIPKITFPCRNPNQSTVERSTSYISNELSSDCVETHSDQPLLKGNKNGAVNNSHLEACRRLSAREVLLGGKIMNKGKFQTANLKKGPTHSVGSDSEGSNQASQGKVPVVMITSC